MSYSIQEAKNDQQLDIDIALMTRDSESLKGLAQQLKKQGEDEKAEQLLTIAKAIEQDEHDEYWAYDEWVDNNLE
jgi:hypothetical protein